MASPQRHDGATAGYGSASTGGAAATGAARASGGRTYIVGDIHGCFTELLDLLRHVSFRTGVDRLIHVGDLVAKGPDSLGVVRWCRQNGIEGACCCPRPWLSNMQLRSTRSGVACLA